MRLLAEIRRALDEVGAGRPLAALAPGSVETLSGSEAPLLHGRTLVVDTPRAQRLLRDLAALASDGKVEMPRAASLRGYRPSRAQAMELVQATVRQDQMRIEALAAAAGIDPGALTSIAALAAIPVLVCSSRLLQEQLPRFWSRGYCPICGGPPILVEQRGLDRSRWPRCARCGGQWEVQWLCCICCGEREHERLGSLVPEEPGEVLTVETCVTCHSYLKSVATLQPLSPFELLLRDLETVELDLVALDRGYHRPLDGGFPPDVRILAI